MSLGSPSYSGVEGDAVNITVQLTRVATDIPIYVLLSTSDVSAEGKYQLGKIRNISIAVNILDCD